MKTGSDDMRQRIGMILGITGVVLLVKPNFDPEQMMLQFNYIVANYWPVVLVVAGMIMLGPKNKRKRSRNR